MIVTFGGGVVLAGGGLGLGFSSFGGSGGGVGVGSGGRLAGGGSATGTRDCAPVSTLDFGAGFEGAGDEAGALTVDTALFGAEPPPPGVIKVDMAI